MTGISRWFCLELEVELADLGKLAEIGPNFELVLAGTGNWIDEFGELVGIGSNFLLKIGFGEFGWIWIGIGSNWWEFDGCSRNS